MSNYRFVLDRSSKKFICPECGKKRFVRFMDSYQNQYLPEQYGRCDRGDGHYFLSPYKDGYAKTLWREEQSLSFSPNNTSGKRPKSINNRLPVRPEKVYFDIDVFERTLVSEKYTCNVFLHNLRHSIKYPFPYDDVSKVVSLYFLGTISKGYRKGAITFPFIDYHGRIHAVQVKQFDKSNHTIGTDWLHSILEKHLKKNNEELPTWLIRYLNQDGRVTCLFGEHLLHSYPENPVVLVEAPKTAIYGTLYMGFPHDSPKNPIWLAVFNKGSYNQKKLKVLNGRRVIVCPDLSKMGETYKEWYSKTLEFKNDFQMSTFWFLNTLEKMADDKARENGHDLADFLERYDWRHFRENDQKQSPTLNCSEGQKSADYILNLHFQNNILMYGDEYPALWDTSIGSKVIDEKTKRLVELIHEHPDILEDLQAAYRRKISKESLLEVL